MRESTNYKFNLPDKADQFNLDHWNQNTEKLDEKLKSIDDLTNDNLKTSLLNFIYPVGSLYWSSNPTDPSILFGGTWKQIKDRFILAAGDTYSNGATGGNANTTLTVANLPSHTHGLNNHTHSFTPSGKVSAHSHGLNNHTHSFTPSGKVEAHSHGLNNHTHSFTPSGKVEAHSHGVGTLATSNSGSHTHSYKDNYGSWSETGGQSIRFADGDISASLSAGQSKKTTESAGSHTHTITGRTEEYTPTFTGKAGTTGKASSNTSSATPTFTGTEGTTGGASGNTEEYTPTFAGTSGTTGGASSNTTATGSGTAFSNMPPYVVKYCWERTA